MTVTRLLSPDAMLSQPQKPPHTHMKKPHISSSTSESQQNSKNSGQQDIVLGHPSFFSRGKSTKSWDLLHCSFFHSLTCNFLAFLWLTISRKKKSPGFKCDSPPSNEAPKLKFHGALKWQFRCWPSHREVLHPVNAAKSCDPDGGLVDGCIQGVVMWLLEGYALGP